MEFAGRLRRAKLDGYIFPIVQLSFELWTFGLVLDFRAKVVRGASVGFWLDPKWLGPDLEFLSDLQSIKDLPESADKLRVANPNIPGPNLDVEFQ